MSNYDPKPRPYGFDPRRWDDVVDFLSEAFDNNTIKSAEVFGHDEFRYFNIHRESIRNDQTPEGASFWQKFEDVGKNAPEWFKERILKRVRDDNG